MTDHHEETEQEVGGVPCIGGGYGDGSSSMTNENQEESEKTVFETILDSLFPQIFRYSLEQWKNEWEKRTTFGRVLVASKFAILTLLGVAVYPIYLVALFGTGIFLAFMLLGIGSGYIIVEGCKAVSTRLPEVYDD